MSRWSLPILLLALATACADRDLPSTAVPPADAAPAGTSAAAARERLAERLAIALRDPATRAALKQKLDRSRAPEHKLQFQALARAEAAKLLASLATGSTSIDAVLADLDQARHLELYLPVESHRAAWQGDEQFLVATAAADGEAPVAFDTRGVRHRLDPATPPTMPVLALVPQETDFTGGRPHLQMSCWDYCGGGDAGGGGGGGGSWTPRVTVPGLYLTTSHFEETFESWIKGNPEFEYHVYGDDASGNAVQLACTGEHSGGMYAFDQNDPDWSGSALLISDAERQTYEQRAPGKPIRIIAMEDDDEACVARVDVQRTMDLIQAIDAFYKAYTSGKLDPTLFRGIKAAPSAFNLLKAMRSWLTTADDFIGTAVEVSVAGGVPGGANLVLKGEGTRTFGWFGTESRR
ncbi:MAG: hypothetical protein H0W15_07870 [Gemmatimonadales bacterium]|nr:hypothetical protein [Gemmatimonadales bacterium]